MDNSDVVTVDTATVLHNYAKFFPGGPGLQVYSTRICGLASHEILLL